ncbi:MAG: AAC(3) family N-acetyltransferase [Aliivibrio sp.]|uniref:AAC(3) family N-acetyltransferase n=1 Tax=Aliivibrio sp. TaxID=1872443 RepID=UPI001A3ED3BC|nr:AAC(3) family N-acetyltransferase [Aliivibrio sp.]
MNRIFSLIGFFPRLEVLLRLIYWTYPAVQKVLTKFKKSIIKSKTISNDVVITLSDLKAEIQSHGIGLGDILIVHSSMDMLKRNDISELMVIDMLLDIIGDKGTLVMPAIPWYREAPKGMERLTKDVSDEVWTYNVQKSFPWTGSLPARMMGRKDARRGRHPLNTIVAIGAKKDELFQNELSIDNPLPCGPESPWAVCAKQNAKILALGVDLVHSLTMIHVAEDCYSEVWPIKDWYRTRRFRVVDNGNEEIVQVRERHPKWASFFAQKKLSKDLVDNNISRLSVIQNVSICTLESNALLTFLKSKRGKGYPYYLWKNAR